MKKAPVIIAIGGVLTAIAAIFIVKGKTKASTGGSFIIMVDNLPSGAAAWNCAFQDPSSGIWYQATNRPLVPNFVLPGPLDSNDFTVPVSSGLLSISAFDKASGTIDSLPTQIVNYQINFTVKDGAGYIFDFNTQLIQPLVP